MKKIIVLLLMLMVSVQTLYAHNPLSAMYYLEVKNNISILNINLSQNGLNAALKKHYPKLKLEGLSELDYKQLTAKYLKENFYLEINGQSIHLLEGGIKLGNHQTDAKFITTKLPATFKNLNVHIKSFIENENHQTVFSLLLNGNTSKVILNKKNEYSASVTFKDDAMIVNSKAFNKNYLWCLAIIPIFMIGKKLVLMRKFSN